MSRTLSPAAVRQAFAQNSSEAFLMLLTINHSSMSAPLRVVNNPVDVASRGNAYIAFPFMLALPKDVADEVADVQLRISNVDRRIIASLRAIPDPLQVTLEVVTKTTPDVVEAGPFDFDLLDATYDKDVITGRLGYEPLLHEPFPAGSFTPQDFPALFAS